MFGFRSARASGEAADVADVAFCTIDLTFCDAIEEADKLDDSVFCRTGACIGLDLKEALLRELKLRTHEAGKPYPPRLGLAT